MEQSFIQQFRGESTNSNLPIEGKLEFIVKNGKSVNLNIGGSPHNTTLTVVGNGHITVGGVNKGTSYTFPSSGAGDVIITSDSGDIKVYIDPKYQFDYFRLKPVVTENGDYYIDMEQLGYNESYLTKAFYMMTVSNGIFSGIEELLNSDGEKPIALNIQTGETVDPIEDICVDKYLLAMDAATKNQSAIQSNGLAFVVQNLTFEGIYTAPYLNLATLDSITHISNFRNLRCDLRGNIKYLGRIKHTSASNTVWTLNYENVTGTIEELVAYGLSKDASGGKVNIEFLNRFLNVTYGGTSLSEIAAVKNNANTYVSWDAQGNVTFGQNS